MRPARFLRAGGIALGLLAAVGMNWAQQSSQTPTTGGTTTTPSTPTPTVPSTPSRPTTPTPSPYPTTRQPTTDQQQTNPIPEIPRPVFISGKVVLEDGTPPPDLVKIERDCGGVIRPEGYTDSKGRFSFQVGQNPMAFMDASVGGYDPFGAGQSSTSSSYNRMNLPRDYSLEGCEIRASYPGYRSDAVSLVGHRYMDNPEIGTIVLRRNGQVEGTTVSITSLLAPKEAQKAYQKGRDAARKSKWEEARKQLQNAVGLYPKYAIAWSELGTALEQLKDVDGARKAYQQALAADPKFVNPYLQLAHIDLDRQQWQSAADTSSQAIRLDPLNFPSAYVYNSLAEYNLKHLDAAEASAREALKLDTSHSYPLSDRIMAAISTVKGDLTAAAQYLRSYLKSAPSAGDAAMVRQQLQQIERRP